MDTPPIPDATDRRIKRQGLPEALAESLRQRILNGEIRAGDALIQDVIAREYDVSRMPVREALRQLEAWGLVSMKLHKGAVVSSLPLDEIAELFELRAMLECDILARAVGNIGDQHVDQARGALEKLEDSYRRREAANWSALNWEFHRSLYLAANRPQTLAVIQGINLQTARYIQLQLLLTRAFDAAEQEHRELLRLCAARDVTQAVPYLRAHILDAGRNLLAALRNGAAASAA